MPEISGGIQLDFEDVDAAIAAVTTHPSADTFRAIVGTDDGAVELASRISAALELEHNPVDAVRTARRKDIGRAVLQRAGCAVPAFFRIRLQLELDPQLISLPFPCVLKPLSLSGSRGVIRVDDLASAHVACARIAGLVSESPDADEANELLAEAYIDGEEIALEGMLTDGVLEVLAVFDKPDPLIGPYFEETYYITPSRLPVNVLERVKGEVSRGCAAYGLRRGPVHAELRIRDGEPWLLEIAARTIGGDCARLLRFGTGASLEALVLLNALGRKLPIGRPEGAAGVLMIPTPAAGNLRRVEGVIAAGAVAGVEDVVIAVREGYELKPLPDGSSYLGFVFARGETPALVEAALRHANSLLKVVISPAWKLEAGGGGAS